ncbi:MAG: hypothetical protein N2260_03745 [Syntrophobacterales bacterium]|nr:hypothetical protein [Syntrophobacterales bacterium]
MMAYEGETSKLKKVVLGAIVFLVVVELIIYLIAASSSGIDYRVVIEDKDGRILYETPGKHLTRYEEMSFQSRYGSIENYIVRVVSTERPFPFRAWLVAAIGIPIGGLLILAFLIRGFLAIFDDSRGKKITQDLEFSFKKSPVRFIQSLSLFHLGGLILLFLLALWIIPNVISELAVKIIGFMERHPGFFIATFVLIAGVVIWVIYLKYKLAKEAVRYQFELAKIRLERSALENRRDMFPELPESSLPSIASGEIQDKKGDHNEVV